MRILLINPEIRTWARPNCFPLGLGYVAAGVREAGHEVAVLDLNVLRWQMREDCERKGYVLNTDLELLLAADGIGLRPDAVGLTGIATQYHRMGEISTTFKRVWPEVPVFAGGALATALPAFLMAQIEIDLVVRGEGDRWAYHIETNLQKTRRDRIGLPRSYNEPVLEAHLDRLPHPAWGLFPVEAYVEAPIGALNSRKWIDGAPPAGGARSMNIISARGCPMDCRFCSHDFLGSSARVRPARSVVVEMLDFESYHGPIHYWHFTDDLFFGGRRREIEAFCAAFGRALPGRTWGCALRADVACRGLLKRMADAGCRQVALGIESGSQAMLDAMNKRTLVSQNVLALEAVRREIGPNCYSIMLGFPGETDDTLRETVEFVKAVGEKPEAVFFATPYPGSWLWRWAHGEEPGGRRLIEDDHEYLTGLCENEQGRTVALNCSSLPDEALLEAQAEIMGGAR